MPRPTLSVVMPNYNHAKYLRRAIEGIVQQSQPPDEFLILDDASSDESVEILEEYTARHACIRVLRNETNQGAIRAHDRLFQLASCDYILPAAADDERLPEFFEQAMRLAEQHPQAGLIFGKVVVTDESDREIGLIEVKRWQSPLYADPTRYRADYLEAELASHAAAPGTIYRRQPFMEVGGYRAELGSWADSFASRAIGLKYGVCYSPERWAVWRKLTGAYSHASRTDPRRMLDIIARGAWLMRSEPYRDRFPEDFVQTWEREYRRLILWNDWLGDGTAVDGRRPGFLSRNLRRLPGTLRTLALMLYRGDVSCYGSQRAGVAQP